MTQQYVIASVPHDVTLERHNQTTMSYGWDAENISAARAFGDLWLNEARSAVLLVPSVVAKLEWDALVNLAPPDATR